MPKLESLSLEGSGSRQLMSDSSQLSHIVRSQNQLRSLHIDRVWDLTEEEKTMLEVPSSALPLLSEFTYVDPNFWPNEFDDSRRH